MHISNACMEVWKLNRATLPGYKETRACTELFDHSLTLLLEGRTLERWSQLLRVHAVRMMKRRLLRRFIKKLTVQLRRKKNERLLHSVILFQDKTMNQRCDMLPSATDAVQCGCTSTSLAVTATVAQCTSCARSPQPAATGHVHPMLSADSGLGDSDEEWWEEGDNFEEEEEDAFLSNSLEDWRIPAAEMSLEKVVAQTQAETLYSAYWHGSVMVHARPSQNQESTHSVLMEATTLSHIRHENIQLFLGVCSNLRTNYTSIVMDQLKGDSLYTLLHREGHEFNFQAVTKIMSQIAQGMEYLHAKGISHPLLTSRSISIHYRICISMLSPCGASSGSLEAGELIYLPPEEMRAVCVQEGKLSRPRPKPRDFTSNIFSFGTIVYEMVTMSHPFSGVEGHSLIWQVGNGRCPSLERVQEGRLKDVVRGCWQAEAVKRPSFEDLLWTIEQNMSPRSCGLKSHFSFSEPSQLAKLGL